MPSSIPVRRAAIARFAQMMGFVQPARQIESAKTVLGSAMFVSMDGAKTVDWAMVTAAAPTPPGPFAIPMAWTAFNAYPIQTVQTV